MHAVCNAFGAMVELSAVLAHSQACIETAKRMRVLFDVAPATTEKVAAHAFFCRCIDHFRATVLLAQQELDAEALALVRGIVETSFVIGGLLSGALSTEELEAFDRAAKAKEARAMDDFLQRAASSDLQKRMRDYAERNAGPTLKFEALAKQIDAADLYNGHYRMFSNQAAHPSMSSVAKYLDYGADETRVIYPGVGHSAQKTILIAASVLTHTCAAIEHWIGTTREINQAIKERLEEFDSFGPLSSW